jgi:hypothetical protein
MTAAQYVFNLPQGQSAVALQMPHRQNCPYVPLIVVGDIAQRAAGFGNQAVP